MWQYLTAVLFLLWTFITDSNASRCTKTGSFGSIYYTYCFNDCCGSYGYQYCCSSSFTYTYSYVSYTASAGVIAGAVIGSIIFVGVIIAIIVCVCIASRAGRFGGGRGQVIRSPAVVTTTVGSQQVYPTVAYNNQGFIPPQPQNVTQTQYPNLAPAPTNAPYPTQAAYPPQSSVPTAEPPPYPGMGHPEKSAPAYM